MNGIHVLNNMFGYNTSIPDAPVTRQHRIGVYTSGYARTDKDVEREQQRKVVPPKNPNALKDSEKRILMIVKCNNGITAIDAANKTKWTTNHCSMILTALFRKKLITRIKHSQSGTRWYAYHARKV